MADELNLAAAVAEMIARAGTAMQQVVTDSVFARSQELVPRDTGALADSGVVSEAVIDGDGVSVTIAYGTDDATAQYAVPVHENLSAIHPQGQAKWLEISTVEVAPRFAELIATRMR